MKQKYLVLLGFFIFTYVLTLQSQEYYPLTDSNASWIIKSQSSMGTGYLECGLNSYQDDTVIKSISQQYLPFPADSATWYVVHSWSDPFPPYVFYETQKYEASGDTMINNKIYTKYYYVYYDTVRDYRGAYRVIEDSCRVYYFDEDQYYEKLVYDFSMLPGDTVYNGHTLICIDTSTLVLNNGIKHYTLTIFEPLSNCYQTWVEGMGSLGIPLYEPLWGCAHTFETAFNLTCYFFKQEHLYLWDENPFFSGCIGTNVSINELDERNCFVIAPNPVTKKSILISNLLSKSLIDFQILDVNGRILKKGSDVRINQVIINSDHYPNGFYILRIQSEDFKHHFSIKFIISKN